MGYEIETVDIALLFDYGPRVREILECAMEMNGLQPSLSYLAASRTASIANDAYSEPVDYLNPQLILTLDYNRDYLAVELFEEDETFFDRIRYTINTTLGANTGASTGDPDSFRLDIVQAIREATAKPYKSRYSKLPVSIAQLVMFGEHSEDLGFRNAVLEALEDHGGPQLVSNAEKNMADPIFAPALGTARMSRWKRKFNEQGCWSMVLTAAGPGR